MSLTDLSADGTQDSAPAVRELLTHSRMACAKACLRRHYYAYELGLRRDIDSQPLRMGSAVHLGLDLLAQGKTFDDAATAIRTNYSEIAGWCTTIDFLEEWLVECETCVRLVRGYVWRWGDDGAAIVATEQFFDIPLVNPKTGSASTIWRLAGKIDKSQVVVMLEPDIAEVFTTPESVNAALRALILTMPATPAKPVHKASSAWAAQQPTE